MGQIRIQPLVTLVALGLLCPLVVAQDDGARDDTATTATSDKPQGAAATPAADTSEPKPMLSLTRVDPAATPFSDYTGDFLKRGTMTGDWGGKRQELYESGITFDASLTQVFQRVVSGGNNTNDNAYTGWLEYGLTLDTAKLDLWPAGLFTFNAETGYTGQSPLGAGSVSPTNFTAIYPTSEKPDTVLMEYYWTQALSKDVGIIVGRVNAVNFLDRNRFANDPRNQFLNISMGNDPLYGAFISFSTYGVLASIKLSENLSINPAIYDPDTQPGNYGQDIFRHVGLAAEMDYTWTAGKDLGGTFRVTGIWVSKDAVATDNPRLPADILLGLPPETKSGNWIIALNAEQYIWKPGVSDDKTPTVKSASFDFQEPGLGLFARFSYTPEDRNLWNIFASAGVGGRGLIPGRQYDRAGVGFYWLKESGDLDSPLNLIGDEWGFEAFYNIAVTPSVQLSFDLQWIDSGVNNVENPVVLGMRLFTAF